MEAGGVGVALSEIDGCVIENAFEESAGDVAPEAKAAEGALRNSRVDEYHWNISTASFAEEIGPDFRFDYDDQRRMYGAKCAADGVIPIEREIKYAVGEVEAFAGEFLASVGGGGDKKAALGKFLFELLGQRTYS